MWAKRAMNHLRSIGAMLVLFGLAGGCGKPNGPPPPTFSVTGEVRHADGQAVAKGVVQFIPESGPWRNISAGIKDGKFTLVTSFGNQVLSGATEGRYRVSIISGFDAHGAPIVNKLPNACEIKTQDNHFVFALPKGAPK